MYLAKFDDKGDIIGGTVKMYVGKISTPSDFTSQSIESFTSAQANEFVNYNIEKMDNVALCMGAMQLNIDDVSYKVLTNNKGITYGFLFDVDPEGITFNTGIAEFNFEIFNKYLLSATELTKRDGYTCLSYGNTRNLRLKIFDIMLVQEDKNNNIKYVWLLFNCYAKPSVNFNTDANSVMVYDHTFVVSRAPERTNTYNETPVYILKITGD